MSQDKVDIYLDYTGSSGAYYFASVDKAIWKDAEKGYQTLRELDEKANHFLWLRPAPANDIWRSLSPGLCRKRGPLEHGAVRRLREPGRPCQACGLGSLRYEESALPAYQREYGFSLRGPAGHCPR